MSTTILAARSPRAPGTRVLSRNIGMTARAEPLSGCQRSRHRVWNRDTSGELIIRLDDARSNVDVDSLADCLIANTSGPDAIGKIYWFLCQHYEASIARDEFIRFLRGEQSELLLRQAQQAITGVPDDLLVAPDTCPARASAPTSHQLVGGRDLAGQTESRGEP